METLRGALRLCGLAREKIASHGVHGVRGGVGACRKTVMLYGKRGGASLFMFFMLFMVKNFCGKRVGACGGGVKP